MERKLLRKKVEITTLHYRRLHGPSGNNNSICYLWQSSHDYSTANIGTYHPKNTRSLVKQARLIAFVHLASCVLSIRGDRSMGLIRHGSKEIPVTNGRTHALLRSKGSRGGPGRGICSSVTKNFLKLLFSPAFSPFLR